jgi:malonyl-CoA decarboxylase
MLGLARLFTARPRPGPAPAPSPASSREVRRAVVACQRLLAVRGEVSGARIAAEVLSAYRGMDAVARFAFLDALAREFSPDATSALQAAEAYRTDPSPRHLIRLQQAVEPPRQELFRRLNVVPGATALLVDIRDQLLAELSRRPDWEPVAEDLRHLFTSWFNCGFLVLRRIDWNSSATVLEKLIRYEAVHPIQGFPDLRRRLGADRRCYAFFHPAMPDEPVVFVEIALVRGMSGKVQPLLDPEEKVADPVTADSATFYSITNCQEGLRGVPLGSFLIKQVVQALKEEFPKLRRFATLSPIPGFAGWLKTQPLYETLAANLSRVDWFREPLLADQLAEILIPACAQYLLHVKRGKEPRDPVARFHLRNGARLERLNWLADLSPSGLQSSFGMMVNYVYDPVAIEKNHERYADGLEVAVSARLQRLAGSSQLSRKSAR